MPEAATVKRPVTPGTVGLVAALVKIGAPEATVRVKYCAVAPSPFVATRLNAWTPALFAVVAVPVITPVPALRVSPAGRAPLETMARLSIAWLLLLAVVAAPKANCQCERSAAVTLEPRFSAIFCTPP